MERRYATVVALTFVLVGLMVFSIDAPLSISRQVENEILDNPISIDETADTPVSQGPLRMNVVPNPSFEDWDAPNSGPDDWDTRSSGYTYGDPTYTGSIKHGNYAGFVESQAGTNMPASSPLIAQPDTTQFPYLRHGLSLSLDWYTIANPNLIDGARLFVMLWTRNTTGNYRTMNYYLSIRSGSYTNSSDTCNYILNDTIGSWHTFDRNITEDYIAAFGLSDFSNTTYITDFYFYASTPTGSTDLMQAVVDDVSMYNSSYSGWIVNGDFEMGTDSDWTVYCNSLTTISQSTDFTDDSHSLNMSIIGIGGGYTRLERYYQYWERFVALEPESNILSWDWKYSDTDGAGLNQWSYLRISFGNASIYDLNIYMGRGNDYMGSNFSDEVSIRAPGFGNRDTWQHSEIDLYEVANEIGFYNLTISTIRFETSYSGTFPDATLEVLIDNLKMVTHPLANPTFEYLDPYGYYDPFLGWWRNSNNGEVTQSTVAHNGLYSANVTIEDGTDGIYRHDLNFKFDPALFIDFWWRLEDIQEGGSTYARIDFEFLEGGGGNRHISYVLGKSSTHATDNDTTWKYILVDGFNQTGTWTRLFRNITADIENTYLTSADDWTTYQITVAASAPAGMRTSLLVDDLHFIDATPPIVSAVTVESTPVYYAETYIRTITSDVRPGVSQVMINYTSTGWISWNTIIGVYNESDWYDVYIPARPYGLVVEFYVIVTDGCGLQTIDDNSGSFYSYTVGDDIEPTLTIDNPANNTAQEGLLAITATAEDFATGIEYVSFNIDSSGPISDYTYPYSQNWNLDDASLGLHFIIITAYDNAGNSVSKIHYITVVDTTLPVLDTPGDFDYTVGELGQTIDWNPTDLRPASYEVFVDTISTYTGLWNSSSEHIVIDVDGLAVGIYNYTCVVTDDGGNSVADTVIVTVL
ncbi:MAG: Ig-like domain-containing protein, partial [Candidatus Thorarchaeota archaeon]